MRRWRLAVAVLFPAEQGRVVDVLRRAVGDPALDLVPPHLTLVPPVNVRAADLGAALAVVRAAAGPAEPFPLQLGPVASFEPVTPTIHLVVSGSLDALAVLRSAVFQPPLWRAGTHPFVPHVTLRDGAPRHQVHAAQQALRAYRGDLDVRRVAVLAERRGEGGRRRWEPVADVDLGGVREVGRGGLPTELAAGSLVDPEARAALPGIPAVVAGPVVVARREGAVIAATWAGGVAAAEPEVADLVRAEAARRAMLP